MRNPFEKAKTWWVRYSDYQWRTTKDGVLYIQPAPGATFTLYNAIGGIAWVSLFVLVGYFFGGVPFVQQHFSTIVVGIVLISVLPGIIGAIKGALSSRKR